ncbi:hypothetical protein SDC9_154574 [bioreactor metagenome]|uniref:Uncharacterized protein n=1 Tax=bioreactor metagenome TaxID=1076179 RepID=A0A645EZ17_9ZZZZ
MVVQRRHFKKALAVGGLEIHHLNNDRRRFRNIDQPYGNQHQRHIHCKRQRRHRAAQKQAAGISHKCLCRVAVVDKERRQPPRQSGGNQAQAPKGRDGGPGKKHHHHKGDAGGQPVDSVRQVHGIDAANDDKRRKGQIHHPVQLQRYVRKGDIKAVAQKALVAHDA